MNEVDGSQFGLTARDMQTIRAIFAKYTEITLVYVFGSRAKGNYRKGSDLDLAVMSPNIREKIIRRLKNDFEESSLPFTVDLVHYPTLTHPGLKMHIESVGVSFYEKQG